MNHWAEGIYIWHGTCFWQEDSDLFNKLPGITNVHARPKGT